MGKISLDSIKERIGEEVYSELKKDTNLALDLNIELEDAKIVDISGGLRGSYYGKVEVNNRNILFFKYFPKGDIKDISGLYPFSGKFDDTKISLYERLEPFVPPLKGKGIYKTDKGIFYLYDYIDGIGLDVAIFMLQERIDGLINSLNIVRDEKEKYKGIIKTYENLQKALVKKAIERSIDGLKELKRETREDENAWIEKKIERIKNIDKSKFDRGSKKDIFNFFKEHMDNIGYTLGDSYANNILITTQEGKDLEERIRVWRVDPDFAYRSRELDIVELLLFPTVSMGKVSNRYDYFQLLLDYTVDYLVDKGLYKKKSNKDYRSQKNKFLVKSLFGLLNTLSLIYFTIKKHGNEFVNNYIIGSIKLNVTPINLLINKELEDSKISFKPNLPNESTINVWDMYENIHTKYHKLFQLIIEDLEDNDIISIEMGDSLRRLGYGIHKSIENCFIPKERVINSLELISTR